MLKHIPFAIKSSFRRCVWNANLAYQVKTLLRILDISIKRAIILVQSIPKVNCIDIMFDMVDAAFSY